MVQLNDIHSLTDFLRNHKTHIQRLASTGQPEVLTVNGKARVVIQDAAAYQKLLNAVEAAQVERIVNRLAALDSGESGATMDQIRAKFRATILTSSPFSNPMGS